LDPVFKLKVQGDFLIAVLVSQNGNRLARVVIAIVKEKDDFSPDFLLKTPSRRDLSEQKSLRKKSARLLAETNNRVIHCPQQISYPGRSFRTAKDSLLQNRRQDQYRHASNKIIPEVPDVRGGEQNEHERLGK
jgi:hypothetical protein